jgi:phosphate transport system substrate-binding protein
VKWLIAALVLAGVAPGATDARATDAKLLITGSSTMAPMVTEMARRFESVYPAIKVEVRAGGSGKGASDLRAGVSSIGMISRPLLDTERELFAFPIARDGVGMTVHADNPLRRITAKQVSDIVTGKITNWKALGGKDVALAFIWSGPGQGTAELLLEHLNLSQADIRTQLTIVDNAARVREVAGNANAIVPLSVGMAERSVKAGSPIRQLTFDGIAATSKTVRNGSYPLSRPLALVTRSLPQGADKRFIDFALSGHVADLFAKYDFVAYRE